MSTITIAKRHTLQLDEINSEIAALNNEKIKVVFEAAGIRLKPTDLEKVLAWTLILVTVKDRQLAVQLNKLSAYVPNLKFVVDTDKDLYSLDEGKKQRRVWQER